MIPATDRLLASFPRRGNGRSGEVRVALATFNGYVLFGIRRWYQDDRGTWRPTKEGVALKVDELPELARAVGEAVRLVEERAAEDRARGEAP